MKKSMKIVLVVVAALMMVCEVGQANEDMLWQPQDGFYRYGGELMVFQDGKFSYYAGEYLIKQAQYDMGENDYLPYEIVELLDMNGNCVEEIGMSISKTDLAVSMMGDKKFLPSKIFKKVNSAKIFKDKPEFTKWDGFYVYPGNPMMFQICFENNKFGDFMNWTQTDEGKLEKLPSEKGDPENSIRVKLNYGEKSPNTKIWFVKERLDGSLEFTAVNSKENQFSCIPFDTERAEKEIMADKEQKEMDEKMLNDEIMAAQDLPDLNLFGIYGDQFNVSVLHFEGNVMTAYQVTIPLGKWIVKQGDEKIYLTPVDPSKGNSAVWTFRVENGGRSIFIDDSKRSFRMYKRESGTVDTIIGTLY